MLKIYGAFHKKPPKLKKFPPSYQPIFMKLIPLEVHHKTTFLAESWHSGLISFGDKNPETFEKCQKSSV